MREDRAADDEVILFTEVNDSFSIGCDVTYSMLSHDSLFLLLHPTLAFRSPSKRKMSFHGTSSTVIYIIFICIFIGGVGHGNGEFDMPCIQPCIL